MVKRSRHAGQLTRQSISDVSSNQTCQDSPPVVESKTIARAAVRSVFGERYLPSSQGDCHHLALDIDSLEEAVSYFLEQLQELGVEVGDPDRQEYDGTLSSLVSHPAVETLSQTLVEVLGDTESDPFWILSQILDRVQALAARQDETNLKSGSEVTAKYIRGELGECELCERSMVLTAHHLIPRETHDLLEKRGLFTRTEMQTRLAWLCRPCHSAVHRTISSAELATHFNTVEKLLENEAIFRWARYASGLKEKDQKFMGKGLREKR